MVPDASTSGEGEPEVRALDRPGKIIVVLGDPADPLLCGCAGRVAGTGFAGVMVRDSVSLCMAARAGEIVVSSIVLVASTLGADSWCEAVDCSPATVPGAGAAD
jgi:hypothetical protein